MTTATSDLPLYWTDANDAGNPSILLITALAVAGILHLFLILAVSFVFPKTAKENPATPPLEIIVLRQAAPSDEKPELADAFAQVNREGGGIDQVRETDHKPVIEPVPEIPEPVPDPLPLESFAPPPSALPTPRHVDAFEPEPVDGFDARPLTATLAPEPTPVPPTPEPPAEVQPEPVPPQVTAAEILASRNLEIAELTARIQHSSSAYANRPRRKAISASTRELKYASYLEAWRRKVLRVGNLNYPEEAKRHKMYGDLILHVALRSDGSVEDIRVLRSSGFGLLDEAAVRIVELAAPFAPFPPDIRAETDILDITRTWRFLSSNRLGWEN